MNLSRHRPFCRVCPEVPGGWKGVARSTGGLLTILTLPVAIHGADEDHSALPLPTKARDRAWSSHAETKNRGSGAPFHPRALSGSGNPRKRSIAAHALSRMTTCPRMVRGSAEKSCRRTA